MFSTFWTIIIKAKNIACKTRPGKDKLCSQLSCFKFAARHNRSFKLNAHKNYFFQKKINSFIRNKTIEKGTTSVHNTGSNY